MGEGLAGERLGMAGRRLFEGTQVPRGLDARGHPVIGDRALERAELAGRGLGQAEGATAGRVLDRPEMTDRLAGQRLGMAGGRGPERLGMGEGLAGERLGMAGGRLFEGTQVPRGLGRQGQPVIGDRPRAPRADRPRSRSGGGCHRRSRPRSPQR